MGYFRKKYLLFSIISLVLCSCSPHYEKDDFVGRTFLADDGSGITFKSPDSCKIENINWTRFLDEDFFKTTGLKKDTVYMGTWHLEQEGSQYIININVGSFAWSSLSTSNEISLLPQSINDISLIQFIGDPDLMEYIEFHQSH